MALAGAIAVYGATGYTGRLVAREGARRGLPIVLSGRDAGRLHAVARELGVDVPVRAAALDDRDALRHALGDCAAVINCAGPFTRLGEPVVRAAVETGTHYVDTTGEQPFMQRVIERYDDAARAAEVAVVPAAGFDYLPGDLISRLAATGHEPLRELVAAYAVTGFAATRGTLHSALQGMRGGDVAYEDGEWRRAGPGPLRASFTFPEPVGRQPVARFPAGEVLTVPRHTRTRKVTTLITTTTILPVPALAPVVAALTPALGVILRTPVRALADAAIDRLPEGPSEEQRRRSRFTVAVLAHGEGGATGRGVVSGGDVYGLTAASAVQAASLLADEGYDRTGVLSPASAFEPTAFLDYLGDHGLTYELDRVAEAAAI
ncbi:MAG TPA: saccharopine dehydrogenase NADP-binding domain-containing protein [Solirubrobacteraceae bacterium]|nr:saccharopine dehydrogenase NADP-binding domain-containing protein [Solirubrobacteraceae bacterium]